jgi:tRNA pseudouridine55 synthase
MSEKLKQHGVLNLLKPPGMTSHDAVAFVRRVLKNKRVGHTGTLDPAAAGVLPICVGQATRLVEDLQAGTKEYLAEATFGYETDTLDQCGLTIRECDASSLTLEMLTAVLEKFRGDIEQTPPMYSAIKIDGKKLYELAREGKEIEIPTRRVNISALSVTQFESGERPKAFLKVECSSGTYIRSLVRDIGNELGLAATMTFLVRTRSGDFELERAVTPQEFGGYEQLESFDSVLENCGFDVVVDDAKMVDLAMGKSVVGEQENRVYKKSDDTVYALCALDSRRRGFLKPDKVFDLRK